LVSAGAAGSAATDCLAIGLSSLRAGSLRVIALLLVVVIGRRRVSERVSRRRPDPAGPAAMSVAPVSYSTPTARGGD
jgi:hypothetical protein